MANNLSDQLAEDKMSFDVWRMLQEAEFVAAGNTNWFDDRKLAGMRTRNRTAAFPRDAYTGAYFVTRAYLTEEAIFWFEHYGHMRYTFADWQRVERDRRATEAEFDVESSDPLADLAYLRDMAAKRGAMIVAARTAGASWADVMAATGMSRMACHTAAKNYVHPAMLAAAVVEPTADDAGARLMAEAIANGEVEF